MRTVMALVFLIGGFLSNGHGETELRWRALPDLPPEPGADTQPGVAGPFAGRDGEVLIVAGGANFPHEPLWETAKVWQDEIFVLDRSGESDVWRDGGRLPTPLAYGTAVTIGEGVLCMGGDDGTTILAETFLLSWDPKTAQVHRTPYPDLPEPCAYGQAALSGSVVYLAGGQRGKTLDSAMANFWSLDLSQVGTDAFAWKVHDPMPGGARAFNLTVAQHDGFDPGIYVMSGRRGSDSETEILTDVWEYHPAQGTWRPRIALPRAVMAGTAFGFGQSHIYVLGGDDGRHWGQADALRDTHPGFHKEALLYHTITDRWTSGGAIPANHVTTVPVPWDASILLPSGEIRPRVRSAAVWEVGAVNHRRHFGWINLSVLITYLALMVGVGLYFSRSNATTDDFFRGGKGIAWWLAGCSIFATMLSSLTFTGIPSKAFAQDWVLAVGNLMIPVVAVVAVFVAMPFYRKIDATSAYEYLEKRFSRPVRQIGSAFFTLFHVFRMAIVMALTGYALAAATPLSPIQSVLLMGVLSVLYSSMGGIRAVVWTDTIQTVVLLGGAILTFFFLMQGIDGGFAGFIEIGQAADKFRMAHFHWDLTSAQTAFWVIVVGSIGQNLSSYTADQAVVQRYVTTPTTKQAARSIWTNAVLSVFATFLFFGLGAALFAYYQSHPEKLDPSIQTDQILPLFIAQELPAGLAGLIVAGIFAAAQSTISTSMNSASTTLVTDFFRPMHAGTSERGYLRLARGLTILIGILGTVCGVAFVDPEIRSRLDTSFKVIGLFMGVLGGLFLLGVLTRRANSSGALAGGFLGATVMYVLWKHTPVSGYLYTTTGITVCFVTGYLVSLVVPGKGQTHGLTIHGWRSDD